MAGQGVAFHLFPADPPLLGDQVGRAELGDLLGAVAGLPALGAAERVTGHRRADRDHAHVLDAAGHDEIGGAAEDGLGGEVDRLLRRAALAVHGDAGHRLGQARGEPGGAGDVAGLRADRVHAAEDHVVDGFGVGVGAVEDGLDDVRAEVGRVRSGEAAAPAGDRRADGLDDVGLGHRRLPGVECVARTRSTLGDRMRIAYTPEQEELRRELRAYFATRDDARGTGSAGRGRRATTATGMPTGRSCGSSARTAG